MSPTRFCGAQRACAAGTRGYRCDSEYEQFRGRIGAAKSPLFFFRFLTAEPESESQEHGPVHFISGAVFSSVGRKAGIEPATNSLKSCCSTVELSPWWKAPLTAGTWYPSGPTPARYLEPQLLAIMANNLPFKYAGTYDGCQLETEKML